MIDPNDFETINYLRIKLGCWLNVYFTSFSGLQFALKSYKRKISDDFNKIIEENIKATAGLHENGNISKIVEAVPIVRILDSIIEHAISSGASDIHFEPFRDKLLVRYRLDGVLSEILTLPKDIAPILAARIKVISKRAARRSFSFFLGRPIY